MSEALTPDDREALSSYLDHESAPENNSEIESQLTQNFPAQVHFRNLEAVSRASQQSQAAKSPVNDDFLNRLMFAVEDLTQDDPSADFECVSAWYDQEFTLEETDVMAHSGDWVHNLNTLTQALQNLPLLEASPDFSNQVMAAIESTLFPAYETLSASFDGETQFQDVREFSGAAAQTQSTQQLNNINSLSQAMQRLPGFTASNDFADKLMQALPQAATNHEDLSAWHDIEANFEIAPESPWLQNIATVGQALRALPEFQASTNFATKVMAQIDQIETLETQSALYDGEISAIADSQWQAQFSRLSQVFTQASTFESSPEFMSGLSQRLDEADALSGDWAENLSRLSRALQALPSPQAPANFVDSVMRKIDSAANTLDYETQSAIFDGEHRGELTSIQTQQFAILSQAIQNLPQMEAPTGFAEQVMQAIDAQANFETLSAWHDQELDLKVSQSLEQKGQASRLDLKQIQTLSKAIQALPQKQAPENFVARVMLATEQASLAPAAKAKLFALPGILGTRMGQMVAGFAIFGVLIMVSQMLLNQTQPGTTGVTAAVPSNYIVQVEHQPEDLLFSSNVNTLSVDSSLVMEATLENISEIDYNLMIGG